MIDQDTPTGTKQFATTDRPPRSPGPVRRGVFRLRLRDDAVAVRGHHGVDRRGRDRQVEGAPRSRDNAVILDVGFKSEGAVPLDEFKDPPDLKEGDEVEVFLEHLEDQEGAVVLSKKKADFMRVWEKIRVALRERPAGRGHARQEDQGRRGGRPHGRRRVPPGQPDRAAPGAEHRRAARPEATSSRSSSSTSAAATSSSRAACILENERADKREYLMKELAGRTRCGRASSRTSPTSARSSTSAASTACSTSPTCRRAASRIRPRWCRSARRSRSRSSTSTGSASASRSA